LLILFELEILGELLGPEVECFMLEDYLLDDFGPDEIFTLDEGTLLDF